MVGRRRGDGIRPFGRRGAWGGEEGDRRAGEKNTTTTMNDEQAVGGNDDDGVAIERGDEWRAGATQIRTL